VCDGIVRYNMLKVRRCGEGCRGEC